MKKALQITIPQSWADITLRKWLELRAELENYKGDEEAGFLLLLLHLCGLEPGDIRGIPQATLAGIKSELAGFIGNQNLPLQRVISVDGGLYGFEPDLSRMSYGAYADITRWDTLTIDRNWEKVMSILYRPITSRKGDYYTIEGYRGEGHGVDWMAVGMDIHFGALFFFVNLWTDLLKNTLNYLIPMGVEETDWPVISQGSGEPMEQLLNWQVEISSKLTRLQASRLKNAYYS